jgi:hypothetical protein
MVMLEIIISTAALILTLYAAGSIIAYSIYNGITPMPTAPRVKRKLLEIIDERQITGKVFELGSGWGTLAIPLARVLPRCQVIACENSSIPYIFSRFAKTLSRHENLKIIRENFFRISLTEADLIVCYLYPGAMERLKIKFERELKGGCLVISSTFAIPEWRAQEVIVVPDQYRTKIYVYSAGSSPPKEDITAFPIGQR